MSSIDLPIDGHVTVAKAVVEGGPGVRTWSADVASFHESLDGADVPADVVAESAARTALLTGAVARLTGLLDRSPALLG